MSISAYRKGLTGLSALATSAMVAGTVGVAPAIAQEPTIEERKFIHAPWSPDDIGALRKKYGLVGPGPQKAYPKPVFPGTLKKPNSAEEMMPNARATVRQTGGRAPLGLVKRGEIVLIVVPYDADPMVQEAVTRAFKERGVEARILYENDLAKVKKEDVAALTKAKQVFDATDGQQEFRRWFFRSINDKKKARNWFKQQDKALHDVTFPKIDYPNDRIKKLNRSYSKTVRKAIIKYLDDNAEVNKVFWRTGGRTRTRKSLKHHGRKFVGNYTYNNYLDVMSGVPGFPSDVWRLVETKTIEPIAFIDRGEISDPEGTALAYDITPQVARQWAKGVYQQGHLYMYPPQAAGRWPYSLVDYPSYASEYLPPIQVESAKGVIAATNDHMSTHTRMEIEIEGGKISRVKGGGYYGDLLRLGLKYPGMQDLVFPGYKKKGYWWLYEAGTGTNPKYFKHPVELLRGRNSSERNVGGAIHWSFGAYAQHGPEEKGKSSPKRKTFGELNNVPIDHCCHNHTLMATYQLRIRDLDQWVTVIEHGRLTALDDLYVRALASRYGNPDDVLRQDYVPPLPGINIKGDYNEYARNPGAYWIKWSKSVMDGSYAYFRK